MANVTIRPMPQWARKLPERLRPQPHPVFGGGAPTEEDRELARALFLELDPESQQWYQRGGVFRDL